MGYEIEPYEVEFKKRFGHNIQEQDFGEIVTREVGKKHETRQIISFLCNRKTMYYRIEVHSISDEPISSVNGLEVIVASMQCDLKPTTKKEWQKLRKAAAKRIYTKEEQLEAERRRKEKDKKSKDELRKMIEDISRLDI